MRRKLYLRLEDFNADDFVSQEEFVETRNKIMIAMSGLEIDRLTEYWDAE